MRILLVEDDREVAGYVRRGLEEENNLVTVSSDGATGLRVALQNAFDIIVLDVMLPLMSGFEITERLRRDGLRTPILLLTARDAPEDVVCGLDAGADDYLTKPFSFDVLLARIRARTRTSMTGRRRFADLLLDPENRQAWRGTEALVLTKTEFSILECLLANANQIVSRRQLIDAVWGPDRWIGDNNLDVFMRFLRKKLDLPGKPRLVETVRGVGYRMQEGAW
jgi:DNA-binding response OmpR family regulator